MAPPGSGLPPLPGARQGPSASLLWFREEACALPRTGPSDAIIWSHLWKHAPHPCFQLCPAGDPQMQGLVAWRGSSEMFLWRTQTLPLGRQTLTGLTAMTYCNRTIWMGQITATHFPSNHSHWNSDMLTPRIIALSLKKKKKKERVGMFWIFPSNIGIHDSPVGPSDQRATTGWLSPWVLLGEGRLPCSGVNAKCVWWAASFWVRLVQRGLLGVKYL